MIEPAQQGFPVLRAKAVGHRRRQHGDEARRIDRDRDRPDMRVVKGETEHHPAADDGEDEARDMDDLVGETTQRRAVTGEGDLDHGRC